MPKDVTRYDPEQVPDPEGWLALDESERIELAFRYHRDARVKLPNARVHAVIHGIVETQIAMGDATPVRATVRRLQQEGLDRHDAIHAVGSVLAKQIYDLSKGGTPTGNPNEAYWTELKRLSAKEWRRAR